MRIPGLEQEITLEVVLMAKKKGYEYHKQNEYPGERVAEKKRVAEREELAERRADARVAAKGKRSDAKMDSEIRRSTNRAERVDRRRDAADSIGLAVIAGLILIILVGSVWGFIAIQDQSDRIDAQSNEINTLNSQLAEANLNRDQNAPDNRAEQVQLYSEFTVATYNMNRELIALDDYDTIYSNIYQLCLGLTERDNNVNHALYRFAQKQLVYYQQIAVLDDKPQCNSRIQTMRSAMEASRVADERLYVLTKNLCDEITDNEIDYTKKSELGWHRARDDADNKAKAFDDAERAVIECLE